MRSVTRESWLVSAVVLIGMLVVAGTVLPGCSQQKAPDSKSDDDSQDQKPTDPAPGPETTDPAPGPETTDPAPGPETTDPTPGPETTDPAPDTTIADPAPGPEAAAAVEPAKISAFAPAEDLVSQVEYYVGRLEDAVETEAGFTDSQGKIAKDANTLIVIALGLGLHDQDNVHKAAAGTLMKAAQDLAAAKDFAAAKAAVAAVKAAAASQEAAGGQLKWERVASLHELMEQVPLVNTKLKRYISGSRFASKADDTAGYTAVIAIIGQAALADTHEAKTDEQVQQWLGFSAQMRDAAGAVNAAIHAQDEPAAGAAMERLQQSCEDCHAVFHKEEEE